VLDNAMHWALCCCFPTRTPAAACAEHRKNAACPSGKPHSSATHHPTSPQLTLRNKHHSIPVVLQMHSWKCKPQATQWQHMQTNKDLCMHQHAVCASHTSTLQQTLFKGRSRTHTAAALRVVYEMQNFSWRLISSYILGKFIPEETGVVVKLVAIKQQVSACL